MTLIQVFDALSSGSFSYLECKDGSRFTGAPMKVNFCADQDLEPACIAVTADGLTLHFNSMWASGIQGESFPLADITAVG